MGRLPGFLPENDSSVLVDVTVRTIGAQALLVPSPEPRRCVETRFCLTERFAGRMGPVQVVALSQATSATPLPRTTTSRSTTLVRKAMDPSSRHISVRRVSPG